MCCVPLPVRAFAHNNNPSAAFVLADAASPTSEHTAHQDAQSTQQAAEQLFSGELGLSGRFGGTIGHVLAAPVGFALPGAGFDLKLRLALPLAFYLESRAGFSLGVDESGVLGGGYGLLGAIGYRWFDESYATFSSDFHLGLSSYPLIPVPAVGTYHKLSFKLVHTNWCEWDAHLKANLDLLLIAPNASAGAATSFKFLLGDWQAGLEAGAEGEVLIAAVANFASGTLFARVLLGLDF
jgi:hypothetical protein